MAAVEHRLVGSLEVEAGHLHHHVVHVEDILAQFAVVEPFVASRLLVALAAVQGDQQILLVVRQGDVARVGQRRGHIAVRIARVVDQHAVQKFRFGVLTVHPDADVVHAVEKQPVLEFDRLFLLTDIVQQVGDFFRSDRHQIIGDEKAADGYEQHQYDQRTHDFRQGDAGRLEREQFVILAHVAHRHHGGEQRGQRQHHRDQRDGRVHHQFQNHVHAEPFADQLVDVAPHELHDENEKHYEECQDHRPGIGLQYELVDCFHPSVLRLRVRKGNSFTTISVRVRTNIVTAPEGTSFR